jgi:hypothetical protein
MLRSWENRADTFVCDEPFYAYYLDQTGADHPGAADIIEHYHTDWPKVVTQLTESPPDGSAVFYQKHMAQHILPGLSLDWLAGFHVGFLIREPKEVITSYLNVRPSMTLEDTGLPQQVALFEELAEKGRQAPVILDSADVLQNPGGMLRAVCALFDLEFEESMLEWPAGSRETDGIWAPHWYSQVENTTGFGPYRAKQEEVPEEYRGLLAQSNELYQYLSANRLLL